MSSWPGVSNSFREIQDTHMMVIRRGADSLSCYPRHRCRQGQRI